MDMKVTDRDALFRCFDSAARDTASDAIGCPHIAAEALEAASHIGFEAHSSTGIDRFLKQYPGNLRIDYHALQPTGIAQTYPIDEGRGRQFMMEPQNVAVFCRIARGSYRQKRRS